jgi:membrane protein DedA with SNARE-associated domain
MGDEEPQAATTAGRPDRRPSRRKLMLVAAPIIALIVCTNVGDAMAPTLVDTHPALLIALNPRNRNLVLVTNSLDPLTYYGIATVRLLLSDPLFFLLGWWYGDAAITWMERRTRTWGKSLRKAEGWFSKAAYPLIFVAPNQYICLFAGAAGMPVGAFFAVNIAGTIARLYIIRRFGDVFEGPLDDIVEWIGDHRAPLLVITVGLTIASFLFEARKGETEVSSIAHMDEELNAAAAEVDARDKAATEPGPHKPGVDGEPGVDSGPGVQGGPGVDGRPDVDGEPGANHETHRRTDPPPTDEPAKPT